MDTLVKKLHPFRFPEMSPKMAAVVGFIVDRTFTEPAIEEVAITADGYVLARHAGDVGMNTILGSGEDLLRNWRNLLAAAGLNESERELAEWLFGMRVRRFDL